MTEAEFRAVKSTVLMLVDPTDKLLIAAINALTPQQCGITITEGVVVPRAIAEYCLESARMLRQRLEIAPNSPEYRRVCEVQTALENLLAAAQEPRKRRDPDWIDRNPKDSAIDPPSQGCK